MKEPEPIDEARLEEALRIEDALWSGDSTGVPELERLEGLLGRYRHTGLPPQPSSEGAPRGARFPRSVQAAAAALLLAPLALGPWLAVPGYRVRTGEEAGRRVRVGQAVAAGDQPLEVTVAEIGSVVLEPGSRLRVEGIRGGRRPQHELFLESGSLEASIVAAPRVFQVGSPAATTIDLGCRYRMEVDEASGATHVEVLEGQVSLGALGHEVYVPEGAACVAEPGQAPWPPSFVDADPEHGRLARQLARTGTLTEASFARLLTPESAEELLPLFALVNDGRVSREVRRRILTTLDRSMQRPAHVGVEAVLEGQPEARAEWLDLNRYLWRR